MKHNSKAVREFMVEAFDKDELRLFSFDQFPDFYHDFWNSELKKVIIIQELIEYCQRRELIPKLLSEAQIERPQLYSRHEKNIKHATKEYALKEPNERGSIKIEVNGNWANMGIEQRGAFLSAFSNILTDLLSVPRETIKIMNVSSGSIILTLTLPREAIKKLEQLSPQILYEEIGITSIVPPKQKNTSPKIAISLGNAAIVYGNFVVASSIKDSFNKVETTHISDDLKSYLRDLVIAVSKMCEYFTDEVTNQVSRDLEILITEATSESPRKKWWQLSVEGIAKAAENVDEVGGHVLDLLAKIIPILKAMSK